MIDLIHGYNIWEHYPIAVPHIEIWAIVWSDAVLRVEVIWWPVVVIKHHVEDIASQQVVHWDSFLNKDRQLLCKKIAGDKIILILDNVLDDLTHGMDLVVLQSILDCVSVVVAVTVFLQHFVFVNDWVFLREELVVVFTQEEFHRLRIKTKDWAKVTRSKLKKSFEEECWVWLHFDELNNIRHCFTHVEALENEQLSKGDLVDLDLVNFIVVGRNRTIWEFLLPLLLNWEHSVFVWLTPEIHVVDWVNFEVAQRVQRMYHLIHPQVVFDLFLILASKGQDVDSFFGKIHEIFTHFKKKARDGRFPQVESLMLLKGLSTFPWVCW